MTPFGYIYLTVNNVNGKKYIGKRQSSFFQPDYHGSGIILQRAIAKYGIENFTTTVLQWCYSDSELCLAESKYIEEANACYSNDYYNIAAGGKGGNTYAGKTAAELAVIGAKIAAKAKTCNSNHGQYVGKLNSMYGKQHSKEARQRTSASLRANKTRNCSRAWTAEAEAKRQNTIASVGYLWTITDQDSAISYQFFARHTRWLTFLFANIVKHLDRFDWLDLHKYGQIVIKNITIVKYAVNMHACSNEELTYLHTLHDNCLLDARHLRCGQSVTTIENILHGFEIAEEVSRVGGVAIRSAGMTTAMWS